MIGLQIRMAISGNIDQYDQALAQTHTGAIRSAVNRIRTQGRRQIARAGLGRLQKAWRGIVLSETGKVITRKGTGLDPTGRVYSAAGVKGRVDDVLDVFERGVVIVPKAGKFLAIPTKAAPGGRRGKAAGEYPDGTFRAVPIQGGNGRGRGKRRPKRWVLVHKVTNTIWFILVPMVRLKKRLRLRPLVERIAAGISPDIERRWARAVIRLEKAGH